MTDSILGQWFTQELLSSRSNRFKRLCIKKSGDSNSQWHVLDTNTKRLYKDEGAMLVALKCATLFFLTTYRVYETLVDALNAQDWHESVAVCKKGSYCFFGLELAALVGLFDPFKGRILFNDLLERCDERPREEKQNMYRAPCFRSFITIDDEVNGRKKYEIVEELPTKWFV